MLSLLKKKKTSVCVSRGMVAEVAILYVVWWGAGMCNCGSAHDFFPFSAGGSFSCSLSHVL